MRNVKVGWCVAGVLTVTVAVLVTLIYTRFRRDIRAANEYIKNLGSHVIETGCGPIEYSTFGEGYPVLVVHGIFGGFDQGLVIAQGNVGDEFLSIIPSRFGYLRTPIPDGATPAQQADAYKCLLDTLGIKRAAIIGTSAGGTSAIQFALRHPDRCSAMVLFASNAPGETEVALPPQPVVKVLFRSDFIFWMLTTYFASNMRTIMGVPEGFELTPEYEAEVAVVMKTILRVNPRVKGVVFDMFVSNPDINTGYPLEDITAPVLIINALDDPLTLYTHAHSMSERIPGARLLTIENGGHMMLGHEEIINSEIGAFIKENSSLKQ